jgi:hypothetical protein
VKQSLFFKHNNGLPEYLNRPVPSVYGTGIYYPGIPLYSHPLQFSSQLYALPALPAIYLPTYGIPAANPNPDGRLELILIATLILLALDIIFIRPRKKAG